MAGVDKTIAIVGADQALLYLGASEDRLVDIERIVNAVSMRFERRCHNKFKARDETLTLNGTDEPLLDVGSHLVAVTSVTLDGQALVVDTDYRVLLERGQLYRSGGWGAGGGFGNVVVEATVGYDPVPHDMRDVALQVIRWMFERPGELDLQSERIGDYSYTRIVPAAGTKGPIYALDIDDVLDSYTRWAV